MLRDGYVARKSLRTYTGNLKLQIDAMITVIDDTIAEYGGASQTTNPTPYSYTTPKSRYTQDPYRVIDRGIYIRGTTNQNGYYNPNTPTPPVYYPPVSGNPRYISGLSSVVLVENGSNPYMAYGFTFVNSSNFSKEYDIYDFAFQNNINTAQPISSTFLPVSLVREVYSQNNTKISTSFGVESSANRVLTIRNTAEIVNRSSKSSAVITSSTSLYHYLNYLSVSTSTNQTYTNYRLFIAKDNSEAFIVEHTQLTSTRSTSNPGTTGVLGLDIGSFTYGNAGYLTHAYRSPSTNKRYKEYLMTPYNNTNISNLMMNLDLSNTTYSNETMTSPMYTLGSRNFITTTNGYTIKSGGISKLESFFSYSNPSITALSGRTFSFSPIGDTTFQNSKLSDSTYRQYRLLVAEDGSDAHLTEYIEKYN